jgi:tetratricopeptide (TPR) repeat protein
MEAAHWIPLGNARMRGRFLEELCNRGLASAIRRELPLTRDAVWYWERYRGNVWNQVVRASVLLKEFPAASAASERSLHFILRTSGITFVEGAAYVTVPTGIKAYEARGLLEQNHVPEALTLARECLAVLPGAPEIVSPIVQELDRRELPKEADRLFAEAWAVHRRLVETYPESNWAHQNAASLAAACQRSLDEADTLARKAIELDPESRLSQETLAEVHFRKGRRAEALAIMKQLAQREPRNALYQRQLKRYADGPTTSPIPLLIAD